MISRLLALLLVTLPTQTPAPKPAPAPAPATGPVTAESFIPANALSVMRIRSIDALEKSVQSIVPGTQVGDQILGFLPMALSAPVPGDQVDRTSPIILAAVP